MFCKGVKILKKDEEEYLKHSPVDRAFDSAGKAMTVFIYSVFGFFAGIVVRMFSLPTTLDSVTGILWQYLPFACVGSVLFGFLSYRYSRVATAALCFMPGCGISG